MSLEPPKEEATPLPPEDLAPKGTLVARLALRQRGGGVIVPVLTALIAFLIGGIVVAATGHNPLLAYRDIFNGAGLNWFFHPSTDTARTDSYNLTQTLLQTTTLILTGLAVAFSFRAGMFNIGGQGQYFIGIYAANWVGHSFAGMATLPHVLLAIGAATLGGRRARGDLDDHAQLDRDLGRLVSLRRRRSAARKRQQGWARADLGRYRGQRQAACLLG